MTIIQGVIASIGTAGGPSGEPGSPGTSTTWWSDTAPLTGDSWPSLLGQPAATIVGTYTRASTPGNGGIILDSSSYISVPVNLNQGYWTVEFVAEFNPIGYWATMWGNELYGSSTGYLAVQQSATSLDVGSPNGTNSYDIGAVNGTRNYWAFTNSGGQILVYKNGQQIGSTGGWAYPNGAGPGTLFFGARHDNANSALATDYSSGTFFFMQIRDYAIMPLDVSNRYNNDLKITYQLP